MSGQNHDNKLSSTAEWSSEEERQLPNALQSAIENRSVRGSIFSYVRIPWSPIVRKCHNHDRIKSHYKYSLKEAARKNEKYELHDCIWRLKEGHGATISTNSVHAIHGGDRTVSTTPGAHGTVDSQLPLRAGAESEAILRAMERLRFMIRSELQLVLETLMSARDKLVDLDDDAAI
ncbi:hypothetical protein BGZ99_002854, partial [Dissophora globulifera]